MLLGQTLRADAIPYLTDIAFQWAPTLGGECYTMRQEILAFAQVILFQWAPTLGGECYQYGVAVRDQSIADNVSMGTHPWG